MSVTPEISEPSSDRTVRLAVIGAGGQVGSHLVSDAVARGLSVAAMQRDSPDARLRVDLLAPLTVRRAIRVVDPSHVILAAAATNVAWCEANPEASSRINVEGTRTIVAEAAASGARVLFISTDYVFDGTAGPYGEDSRPNPINQYGRQKLQAERIVLAEGSRNAVVRTCQVFGRDRRRRNYVLHVVDELRHGRIVRAAVDLFGTPTYTPDLGRSLLSLALCAETGVFHVAGHSFVSRYELALRTTAAFGLDAGAVVGVKFDELSDGVRRPRLSGLLSQRAAVNVLPASSLDAALMDLAAAEGKP